MIDLIESKLARQEFEQRVRSYTPVQQHDARLTDDRQLTVFPIQSGVAGAPEDYSGGAAQQARRLLSAITSRLSSLGERMQPGRNGGTESVARKPERDTAAL